MKRVIITNNQKVKDKLGSKADVDFREITALEVLQEGRALAEKGGMLLLDPTRSAAKTYYRSLPFMMGNAEPHEASIVKIDQCIAAIGGDEKIFEKAPIMAGMSQNKDLDIVSKVVS